MRSFFVTCVFVGLVGFPIISPGSDDKGFPYEENTTLITSPMPAASVAEVPPPYHDKIFCDDSRALVYSGAFPHSILIPGSNVSAKIGGYAKLDFIQDFNTIGQTDFFDTTTIPTSGPQKGNTRLHARQTRLNLDLRNPTQLGEAQVFVEGDFYGNGNAFRLRHGYGKLGPLLAGQTWSTFMDESVLPDLLDFENPTGALLNRRGLLRWTRPISYVDGLEYSLAMEDASPAFTSSTGTFESNLPDFIGRLRLQRELMHIQLAGFYTRAKFEPFVGASSEADAWGSSLSSSLKLFESDKIMGQVAVGDGIEQFRGFQSYVLDPNGSLAAIPTFLWYTGYEHVWSKCWKSVFSYSRATLDTPTLDPSILKSTDYLATNVLWTPVERVRLGLEYLYGVRVDEDNDSGDANRLQFAIWYYLP